MPPLPPSSGGSEFIGVAAMVAVGSRGTAVGCTIGVSVGRTSVGAGWVGVGVSVGICSTDAKALLAAVAVGVSVGTGVTVQNGMGVGFQAGPGVGVLPFSGGASTMGKMGV